MRFKELMGVPVGDPLIGGIATVSMDVEMCYLGNMFARVLTAASLDGGASLSVFLDIPEDVEVHLRAVMFSISTTCKTRFQRLVPTAVFSDELTPIIFNHGANYRVPYVKSYGTVDGTPDVDEVIFDVNQTKEANVIRDVYTNDQEFIVSHGKYALQLVNTSGGNVSGCYWKPLWYENLCKECA